MKIILNVPYSEKDEAKRHGARWDYVTKKWYAENLENLRPLLRWMPEHLRRPHIAVPDVRPKVIDRAAEYAKMKKENKNRKKLKKMESLARRDALKPRKLVSCDCPSLPWEDCIHTK